MTLRFDVWHPSRSRRLFGRAMSAPTIDGNAMVEGTNVVITRRTRVHALAAFRTVKVSLPQVLGEQMHDQNMLHGQLEMLRSQFQSLQREQRLQKERVDALPQVRDPKTSALIVSTVTRFTDRLSVALRRFDELDEAWNSARIATQTMVDVCAVQRRSIAGMADRVRTIEAVHGAVMRELAQSMTDGTGPSPALQTLAAGFAQAQEQAQRGADVDWVAFDAKAKRVGAELLAANTQLEMRWNRAKKAVKRTNWSTREIVAAIAELDTPHRQSDEAHKEQLDDDSRQ